MYVSELSALCELEKMLLVDDLYSLRYSVGSLEKELSAPYYVYIFMKKHRRDPVYIGSTTIGVLRLFTWQHPVQRAVRSGYLDASDLAVFIYQVDVDNENALLNVEAKLQGLFRCYPRDLNTAVRLHAIKKDLGIF